MGPEKEVRKVKFYEEEQASRDDDVILTLRNMHDDEMGAITAITLEEMEKKIDRDDGVSAITASTLEDMAKRYVENRVRSERSNKWQKFENMSDHSDAADFPRSSSRMSKRNKKGSQSRLSQHSACSNENGVTHAPEILDEKQMREKAAESYETVLAHLNFLKRSIESRQSRKRDGRNRTKSSGLTTITQEETSFEDGMVDGREFGEI